jgi:membrane-associated PAP2 superfamily phosphatase
MREYKIHKMTMMIKDYINARNIMIIMIFLGLLYYVGYSVYVLNQTSIYAENRFLENAQVFILALAGLIFSLPIAYQKRTDKLLLLFFAFLCLSFILREVDVEELNIPNILIYIGSGIGRNVLVVAGFVSILSCAIYNITHYKTVLRNFLLSIDGVLIIIAGVLLFVGEYFEDAHSLSHNVFLEEATELLSYVLILLVAFTYAKDRKNKKEM